MTTETLNYSSIVEHIKANNANALASSLTSLILFSDAASIELIFLHVFMDNSITLDQKKAFIVCAIANGAEMWSLLLPSYALEKTGECPDIINFIVEKTPNPEKAMLSSSSHLQLAIQQSLMLERHALINWLTKVVHGKHISKNMSDDVLGIIFDIQNVIQEDKQLQESFGIAASELVSSLVAV